MLARGHLSVIDGGMSLIADWEAWQHAQNLSERTIRERAGVIINLCSQTGVDPESISSRDIIRYIGRRELKASTKATYFASIQAFTRWCVTTGIRDDDPCLKAPAPKRPKNLPRPITPAQFVKVLAVANRRRTRMMVLLGALAGLRVHEIAKIHGGDITEGTLSVTGKGGATKLIPLHDAIQDAAQYFPDNEWWFPAYDNSGGHVTRSAVGRAISRAMERAGVHATPHQLRHFFGTSLLNAGVDLRTVQELMRHESLQSTQIYTLVSGTRKRDAVDLLRVLEVAS